METQSSNYKTRWVILLLLINMAWLLALTVGGASRNVPAKESLKELRVHSLTIVDEDGYERIRLEAVEGGWANLHFFDFKGERRIELGVSGYGSSEIRLLGKALGTGYPNQFPEITLSNGGGAGEPEILIEDDMFMTTRIKAGGLKTRDILIPTLEARRRMEAYERAAQKKSKQK